MRKGLDVHMRLIIVS